MADNNYDVDAIRARFPALAQEVNGHPLAYLDNAATTQKPDTVLAAMDHYYRADNANVHRAVHTLAGRATTAYEGTRDLVRDFLGAGSNAEVVFTRGTTEAINLVAWCYARPRFGPGDEILITELEHHSNIVPWQLACAATGASLKVTPVRDDGSVDMDAYAALLGPRTRLVAFSESSNAIGSRNPIARMIAMAHEHDAVVLVDAAQAAAHRPLDVQALDVDFLAISGHKMYGPTGVGVLYGRQQLLDAMPPWQGGGDMIETVSFEGSTWNELPYKFEAGTPNIAGVIGLGEAIRFLHATGLSAIAAHEDRLTAAAREQLSRVPGLRIIGTSPDTAAIVSFVMDGAHPQDIGTLLDENGIAIRTGHHCAMPLMQRFGLGGTARASFACYNTLDEVQRLSQALHRIARLFG